MKKLKSLIIRCVVPFIKIGVVFKKGIHVIGKYLGSRNNNIYKFSFNDALLYFHELNWKLDSLNVVNEIGDNYELNISDLNFFWPKKFNTNDLSWIYHEVFKNPDHNPSSYNDPSTPIPKDAWVFDAGASEGFFSKYAFQHAPKLVVAFEPIKELKSALNKTFELECSNGSFKVISAGLGKEKGEMTLYVDTEHPSDASVVNNPELKESKIEIVTIDDMVKELRIEGKGFIKMDIEGAEMDALLGAQDTLRSLKPSLAIAVYHEYENASKCAQIIKSANPDYKIHFRGLNGYFKGKPRPYILFAS